MKYIIFAILVIIGIFFSPVMSQDIPEKKKSVKPKKELEQNKNQQKENKTTVVTTPDSLRESLPFAEKDTIVTRKIDSQVYWYDFEKKIRLRKEEIDNYIYSFRQEKELIYRDMSDIFRQQSLWYNYSLMESGRPAYIASINSYPHQSSFFYNGVMMNDPIHGMFNSQYIPVNFIHYVQHSTGGYNLNNYGLGGTSAIHVISSSKHTRAPWSRILYKQGNYGYSDLDISFVHPATPDIAVQLGGINRVFDGNFNLSERHGTNYRGEITWQINKSMYVRGQFFLNRERAGISKLIGALSVPIYPLHIDLRDDYFVDFTWLPTDTISQRLNIKLFNSYSIRRLKDNADQAYHNRYQFKRYGFDANYNFNIGGFDFLAGGTSVWNKVWGTGFNKQYFPLYNSFYGKINIPLIYDISLKPQVQIIFDKDFDPQLSLSVNTEKIINENNSFTAGVSRTSRFPNATERYFNFLSFSGNENLSNEDYLTGYANLKSKLVSVFDVDISTQYNQIKNEIVLADSNFQNSFTRDYLVIAGKMSYPIWKFDFQVGGFENISNIYLTSRRSGWVKLHFGDIWLNGALGIDAYATFQYWGEHAKINYEPILERFYKTNGTENAFTLFDWKIVATVQDARIFFEMDNTLSENFEIIDGYQEFTQRWRFGVHWILWD